jgi:hypothetical protein
MRPFVGVKMLHAHDYRVLKKTVASRKMPAGKVRRAKIILLRFFQTWDEIEEAISRAVDYWNAHRHPYVWGRRRRRRAARKPGVAGPPGVAAMPGPC